MANPCKRILILSLFLLGVLNVVAQKNTIFRIKTEALGGALVHNGSGSDYGLEIGLELPLYGNKNWEYALNFPTIGFGVGVINAPELDFLSPVIYFDSYFNYPLIHKQTFSLNIKIGGGTAITGTGDKSTGYIVPFTGMLTGGLNMDIALGKLYGNPYSQWSLTLGGNAMITHNGNITKKSRNIAMINGSVGVKYTPNVYPLPIKYPARPVDRVLALEVCGQGGVNQLAREDNEHYYPNLSLNVGFYLPITNGYRIGLGADAFYNSIYDGKQRKTENTRYNFITENKFENKFRAGIFLANDFTIHKFIVGAHIGYYAFSKIQVPQYDKNGDKNGNLTENWLYTKLVMKYKITKNFMINAQFKSHLLKIECFEIGVGYAMPEFSKLMKNPFRNISFKKEDRDEIKID